jgi:DNA-binding beta-propeller fold protein YncE
VANKSEIKDSTNTALEAPYPKRLPRGWAAALLFVVVVVALIVAVLVATRGSRDIATVRAAPRTGRVFAESTSEGKTPTRLNVGYDIGWLLVTPDGGTLYAIELSGRTVAAVGVDNLQIKRRFQLPHAARGAVLSRDGKHMYISSPDDLVMIVDADRGKVERLIPTGGPIFDLAVTPDQKKIFLAMGSEGLKRIQMPSGDVTALSAIACPLFVTMDGEGKRLFATYQCSGPGGREGHDVVEIYDPISEKRLAVIGDLPMVGGRPSISPDGNLIVLDGSDACITEKYDHAGCAVVPSLVYHLVRTSDGGVLKSFARPTDTLGVSFSPDGSRLIFGGDRLVVLDWARDEVTPELCTRTADRVRPETQRTIW